MTASETSPATRAAILDAAERLLAERGPDALTMPAVAAAAGVSRQSVYLAWGGRGGLLAGLLQRGHDRSAAYRRMREIAGSPSGDMALDRFIREWCAHIPEILPAARLLAAAAETDTDARAAHRNDMSELRAMLTSILSRMERAGALTPLWSPQEAADLVWSLIHADRWRRLVEECGWPADLYTEETVALVERIVER